MDSYTPDVGKIYWLDPFTGKIVTESSYLMTRKEAEIEINRKQNQKWWQDPLRASEYIPVFSDTRPEEPK